jgi:hypothetical protein
LLTRGSFGVDAGAVGAASLPLHLNFSPLATILTGSRGSARDDRAHDTFREDRIDALGN